MKIVLVMKQTVSLELCQRAQVAWWVDICVSRLLNGYGDCTTRGWYNPYPLRSCVPAGLYHNWSAVRLLLCEWAGLLLSNLVVPYETTRITGAATVYMGFVLRGGF